MQFGCRWVSSGVVGTGGVFIWLPLGLVTVTTHALKFLNEHNWLVGYVSLAVI